jgi:FkbM family methyltransferase
MRKLSIFLNKPYYLFRPAQLLRRIGLLFNPRPGECEFDECTLPWGLPIRYRPAEMIGSSIARTGVYDLCVTESIWRLLETGETALDIGANIGYMTSVMAVRVGGGGTVIAFEPHPEVFSDLAYNVSRWAGGRLAASIILHEAAASDHSAIGQLATTQAFPQNRGTAAVVDGNPGVTEGNIFHSIALKRLDDVISPDCAIGLLKLDVEGHEIQALKGAESLLSAHRVRDIVFEEHEAPPTPVTQHLESLGYTLYRLEQTLLGAAISNLRNRTRAFYYEPPCYLATCQPERAVSLLVRRGWDVLRLRHRLR